MSADPVHTRTTTVTTTTRTITGPTARWISQLTFAFMLAGLLAVSTLSGAGAASGNSLETMELLCASEGGDWIEVYYPSGALKSVGCVRPDGTGFECNFMGQWCHSFQDGPTTPPKTVPGSGGQVGGDQGLGVGEPAEPASPEDAVTPSAKHKKHKHSHGKGRNRA